jgi:hypothetical protein
MDAKTRVLRRIDDVLQSDLRPDVAYPLRARLGRAVLEIVRMSTLHSSCANDGRAVQIALRIEASSHHIMQPSEPFDSHWPQQWAEVLANLIEFRALIAAKDGS